MAVGLPLDGAQVLATLPATTFTGTAALLVVLIISFTAEIALKYSPLSLSLRWYGELFNSATEL